MNSLIIFAETRQKIHHLHHRKIPETSGVSFPSPISITHCRTQLELNLVDTKYWSDQCAISPNHVNTRSKKTGEENAEISQLRGSIKKLMNYQFLKSNFVRNGAFSKENLHFMHVFFSSPPIVSTSHLSKPMPCYRTKNDCEGLKLYGFVLSRWPWKRQSVIMPTR